MIPILIFKLVVCLTFFRVSDFFFFMNYFIIYLFVLIVKVNKVYLLVAFLYYYSF